MSKERAAQLIDAGIWLRLSGDLEGARKLFERALKLDPANERATQLLKEAVAPPPPPSAPDPGAPFEPPVAPPVAPVDLGVSASQVIAAIDPTPSTIQARPSGMLSMPVGPPPDDLDWGKATGFDSPEPFREPAAAGSGEWGAMLEPPEPPPNPVASSVSATISLGEEPAQPPRSTPPIFGAPASQKPALTVSLDGDRPVTPPTPPPVSGAAALGGWQPPAFEPPPGAPAAMTVTISSTNAPEPSPPRSTPPLFDAASPPPPSPVGLPPPPDPLGMPSPPEPPTFKAPSPVPTNVDVPLTAAPDPVGVAWAWSNNTPAPFREPATSHEVVPAETRPVPQPSPLSPNATSAWDVRSNPGIKLSAIVGEAKALEMISSDSAIRKGTPPPSAKDEVKTLLRGARDLLDLDDHTGAMELITKAQALAPNDPDVQSIRERSEKTLLTMFESKLGRLDTVPRVLLKEDEIIWLNLDHRAGFVLAQIDGTVSFDDLFAVSGMSRLDTARILAQLVDEGVINKG
jgi:tetratricopeptide (TPR) repeat protein